MPSYRFYFTTKINRLVGVPQRHDCADDAQAMIKARELIDKAPPQGAGVEVWEGNRLVGRIPAGER
jgi:hypothetical protein